MELFQGSLAGGHEQLTHTAAGSRDYHPQPSSDGHWLAYGSLRDGVRQLYVMSLAGHAETRITDLESGQAAMWPHWRPNQTDSESR